MSLHLTKDTARTLAGLTGVPVTADPRQAAAALNNGAVGAVLDLPTIEWSTYDDGEASFSLYVASGPVDHEAAATATLDACYLALHKAMADEGWGVDTRTPALYRTNDDTTAGWPAYEIAFTRPVHITELED